MKKNIESTVANTTEANLMWLDVSFNELTTVDKSILTLEHLKSLYL